MALREEIHAALLDTGAIIQFIESYGEDPCVSDSCGCILHNYLVDTLGADEATIVLDSVLVCRGEDEERVVWGEDDAIFRVQERWIEEGLPRRDRDGYEQLYIEKATAIYIARRELGA